MKYNIEKISSNTDRVASEIDGEQLAECIEEQTSATILAAFGNIRPRLRQKYLVSYATYLLETHLQQLTNSELRICSKKDPITAFKLRDMMPPRRHAIILARSYGVVWHTLLGDDRPPFREEALRSLARYPEEWLSANDEGFDGIFRKLSRLLGIRLEPQEFHELLNHMAPPSRQALAQYISSRI